MGDTIRPVPRAFIAGHRPEPGHAGVVQPEEPAPVLGHTTIADRRVVKPVLTNAPGLLDVVQHTKNLAGFAVAVVEEKLGLRLGWVPVKHRALLRVPAAGLLDDFHAVIVFGVDQDDIGRVVRAGHAIVKVSLQRNDVSAALVPRNVLHVADVSEKVGHWAVGDLLDLHAKRGLFCCSAWPSKHEGTEEC